MDNLVLERDWYATDENGAALGDDFHNPLGANIDAQREALLADRKNQRKANPKQIQKQRDVDAWETNRMLQSGVASKRGDLDDFDDDDRSRKTVLVHELVPPFLSNLGNDAVFSKQLQPVSAVADPQSDIAVISRKGSAVVKQRRQQRDREQQAKDRTKVAGTALGNIIGAKGDDEDSAAAIPGEEQKSSKSSGFASHAKKSEAQSSFSKSMSIQQQREYLPIFAFREQLMRTIAENSVIVVSAATGSGKSTQLTQFLYEDGYGNSGLIACTQPRRVAAMSVAKRVSEEVGCGLGQEVGYTIRFEDCTTPATRIKYMTDGVLLRECVSDPLASKYSCIILDEAHERSLNTDLLMGMMQSIVARRRDLKLIITSASLESKKLADFFHGATELSIPGRTFEVTRNFAQNNMEDHVDSAVKQALKIHLSQGPGDMLIFMTGAEDIEATCEILAQRLSQLNEPPPLEILPMYSQLPADMQSRIFDKAKHRKCIIATNIAETSLTVDGIMYVVDAGLAKLKVYNSKMGMDTLQVTPVSQANSIQRAGRAGRTGPGKAFHLYTETEYKKLYEQTVPEIQRTNLANTLLLLKSLGVNSLIDFPFLSPPPQEAITSALYDLWALGAIDNLGNLTTLGKTMTSFPMDPSLAKILVTSADPEYSCSAEILTIVSMLSVPSVFQRPNQREEEADRMRERFSVPESDHLTLMNVFSMFRANGSSAQWCAKHFLHHKSLLRAAEIREQLSDILKMVKLDELSAGTDWDVVRKCICSGYYHQAARVRGMSTYSNLRTSVQTELHPTSALFGLGILPDYVIYHELVLTSKEWMSVVTKVEPDWLAELGGVFYAVREKDVMADVGNARVSALQNKGKGKDIMIQERIISKRKEIEDQMEKDRLDDEKRKENERKKADELRERRMGGEGGKDRKGVKAGTFGVKKTGMTAVKKPILGKRKAGRGF